MAYRLNDSLDRARREAGLSQGQLWLRYFGLGGMTPALELEAILHGMLDTTSCDRDRVVLALNERFCELGRPHPIPYSDDPDR